MAFIQKKRSRPFDFLAACRCNVAECSTHVKADEYTKVELPDTVLPTAYELDLKLRLDDHAFDGHVRISININAEGLKEITLHAVELTFSEVCLDYPDGKHLIVASGAITHDASESTVSLGFGEELPPGEATLIITYSGILNDKMDGFYRSTYYDRHGTAKTMASTFFCATTARKALPCWDEPLRKATFQCSLTVPAHMTALSNTDEVVAPAAEDGPSGAEEEGMHDYFVVPAGSKRVRFRVTPRMSTYLLAFVVSEMDCLEAHGASGVLCRVFTPPGKAALGQWALDHAVLALDRFADLFGVAYPLPKADLVALPEFAMGAMENWGLVTYRETRLLLAETASPAQRQAVAETVVHEVAHQWFGNLVTMAWWDDIWLNEGFATWMENHVCALAHEDWQLWSQFVASKQGGALARDALRSSHPIQMPMERAEMVDEVFDAISYLKGASVIRMLYAVVGEAAFFKGLREYMRTFRYANATTDDLWQALEAASGQKVRGIASDWTRQMGFPLLTLTAANATAGGRVRLMLEQQWFLGDGADVPKEDAKCWTIPIFLVGSSSSPEEDEATAGAAAFAGGAASSRCTASSAPGAVGGGSRSDGSRSDGSRSDGGGAAAPPPIMKLMPNFRTVTFSMPGDGKWVKVNAGQHVPMRVKYPDEMIPHLAAAMRAGELPPVDRIGLLSDAGALCRAGKLLPTLYLELLSTCETEDDPVVLCEGLERMSALAGLLGTASPVGITFSRLVSSIVTPHFRRLGWAPNASDGHLTRKLRATVLGMLPQFARDDAAVCAEARRRFDAYLADPASAAAQRELPSELQAPVFALVLASGGEREFEALLSLYTTLELAVDKARALAALGEAPTPALRQRALELTIRGNPDGGHVIKAQDIALVPAAVHGASDEGREAAWNFFKTHHEAYQARAGGGLSNLMDGLIAACCARFTTKEAVADVEGFFTAHPFPKNATKVASILENMRTNISYLQILGTGDALLRWLEQHGTPNAESG